MVNKANLLRCSAFIVGSIERQTAKALLISPGVWHPKSAITRIYNLGNGRSVFCFHSWYVGRNRSLAYTELGELITRFVKLPGGKVLYQGKPWQIVLDDERPERPSDEELDSIYDELIESGLTPKQARRELSRRYKM